MFNIGDKVQFTDVVVAINASAYTGDVGVIAQVHTMENPRKNILRHDKTENFYLVTLKTGSFAGIPIMCHEKTLKLYEK